MHMSLVMYCNCILSSFQPLTQCGIVTTYVLIDLGQQGFRSQFAVLQHQAITMLIYHQKVCVDLPESNFTRSDNGLKNYNVNLLTIWSSGTIFSEMQMFSFKKTHLKMSCAKLGYLDTVAMFRIIVIKDGVMPKLTRGESWGFGVYDVGIDKTNRYRIDSLSWVMYINLKLSKTYLYTYLISNMTVATLISSDWCEFDICWGHKSASGMTLYFESIKRSFSFALRRTSSIYASW